jgi:RIO kinase 1
MVKDKHIERLEYKKDSQRVRIKRKTEERSAFGGVMDKYTLSNLNRLRAKGVYDDFVGIISAGKEANVYFAYGKDDQPLAIKIYKIDPQNTKWMKNYIIGDPRFQKIGTSTHKIIYTWCKKEYKNLKQLHRHNIPVPAPIDYRSNILVMEYIGDETGSPAPRLKDAFPIENPADQLIETIKYIQMMYQQAHLVHADLSEFNILWHQNKQVIIDVSQSLSIYHINAPVYLQRDIRNILNFYKKFLPSEVIPETDDIVRQIMDIQLPFK